MDAPPPLFVYGTLRDPEILAAVLGRRPNAADLVAADAPDRRTVHYGPAPYPVLVPAPGSTASGLLMFALTPADFDKLDRYEGDDYRRAGLDVLRDGAPLRAQAYLASRPVDLAAKPWTLEGWRQGRRRL